MRPTMVRLPLFGTFTKSLTPSKLRDWAPAGAAPSSSASSAAPHNRQTGRRWIGRIVFIVGSVLLFGFIIRGPPAGLLASKPEPQSGSSRTFWFELRRQSDLVSWVFPRWTRASL